MASSARIEELEKKFNENPRRYFAPLANEYRKAGEIEQAIALCRAYLPQQPGHMSGHIVFGQALFDAGQLDEAQGVFETALSLDPENLIALRHLGDIAHSRGDIAGARGWYRRVLDADPRNEEIAAQLAALPGDGAAAAPESTPAGEAGSVGWGDINPERAAETPAKVDAAPAKASSEAAPSIEIERASAPDDDADLDALFSTAGTTPSRTSTPTTSVADEKTAEVPVYELPSGEREITFEEDAAAASPSATAEEQASPTPELKAPPEPARSGAPSDGLGLEVTEFIPPAATDAGDRALGFETGHEAVVGGPIDGTAPEPDRKSHGTPPGFVTETMAELYLQQGFVQEALNVYRQLLEQNPDDAALRERVAQLQQGARSSVSMAAVSDEVVEAARRRQASSGRRSMRQFLGSLAARRVPQREGVAQEEEPDSATAYEPPAPAAAEAEPMPNVPEAPEAPDERESSRESSTELTFLEGASPDELPYEAAAAPGDLPFMPAEPEQSPPFRASQPSARAGDAIDALFDGARANPDDEMAAARLAGAFDASRMPSNPAGPRGRPTRAAPSELSLDNVFRESGGDAGLQKPRSDFSFDQFFSDSASAPAPRKSGDRSLETSGEAPSADDIGQFNAWLEGLKKK